MKDDEVRKELMKLNKAVAITAKQFIKPYDEMKLTNTQLAIFSAAANKARLKWTVKNGVFKIRVHESFRRCDTLKDFEEWIARAQPGCNDRTKFSKIKPGKLFSTHGDSIVYLKIKESYSTMDAKYIDVKNAVSTNGTTPGQLVFFPACHTIWRETT